MRTDLIRILQSAREDWDSSMVVTESTGIFRDLGLESIDAVGLGSALEDHFGTLLPFPAFMAKAREAQVQDITIAMLLDFLEKNVNTPEASRA
jgi:acyl carrier protein